MVGGVELDGLDVEVEVEVDEVEVASSGCCSATVDETAEGGVIDDMMSTARRQLQRRKRREKPALDGSDARCTTQHRVLMDTEIDSVSSAALATSEQHSTPHRYCSTPAVRLVPSCTTRSAL